MTRNPRTGRFEPAGTRHKCDQQSLFDRDERAKRIDRRVRELFANRKGYRQ